MNTATPQTLTGYQSLSIDHLEVYIQSIMDKWDIPGLSLAIVKDGELVVVKGYGTRDASRDLPVDQHTLFPLAGGSCLITASAIALLVAEGRLSWDDRLVDVLPSFKTGSALINQEATVIDVLARRIGLPAEHAVVCSNPGISRAELLSKVQHITRPDAFRNGKGVGLLLSLVAGEIIPELTGMSWDDFVQERLFAPLNMTDSITNPQLLNSLNNVASPHEHIDNKPVSIPHTTSHNQGPSRSVYSSAADMARWLQFQLDSGTLDSSAGSNQLLIPQKQIGVMRKIHMAQPLGLPGSVADLCGRGLGAFVITNHSGCRVYGMGGDVEGAEAFHSFIPELNLGIAVMVNGHVSIPQRLTPWIIDRYTGAPEKDWTESLADYQALNQSRIHSVDQYRERLTRSSQVPSLPLEGYVGVYQHPYLGDLTIRYKGDRLTYTYGEIWEGELPHANHNTFFREPVEPIYHRMFFRGPLGFNLSVEGEVESLTIGEGKFIKRTK